MLKIFHLAASAPKPTIIQVGQLKGDHTDHIK